MADAMMKPLGEANGVKWYWAEPGQFEQPGVYYWDGKNNVLCVPYGAHPTEAAPAAVQASEGSTIRADAVNLARNTLSREYSITPKGVRILATAVLEMDAALKDASAPVQPVGVWPKKVGAGDGCAPDSAGCCGCTVTARCPGCPHAEATQPVAGEKS